MKRTDPANGLVLRRGSYWFNRTVKKKRRWHNLETADLIEAIQRKSELMKLPEIMETGEGLRVAIHRYLRWKVDAGKYRAISARINLTSLKRFADFMGDAATLASVRKSRIQDWYDEERSQFTAATSERYLCSVKALFRWAIDIERARGDNPTEGILLKEQAHVPRIKYATREVRDQLIKEAPNDDMQFILFAGFHAGLRRTEISEARVFWFDLTQGVLHVQATPFQRGARPRSERPIEDAYGVTVKPFWPKDSDDRTVPLSASFQAFLRGYLKGRKPEEFIGEPARTCPDGFYRWPFYERFARYVKEQGHGWVSPHTMRHTFASLLAIKGVSLFKIAKWLGDTLSTTEKTYAHLAPVDADIQHLD